MKTKQTTQLRVWTFINLFLIIVIAILIFYYFNIEEEVPNPVPLNYNPGTLDSSHYDYLITTHQTQ
ncbi:hypothetical protein [Paenibacillus dakarensis]|uniref:hypothetical protein n=1 Tax=Paenibacillus dakarensis TaxID=1527293 RepID=UPI0012E1EFC9|nr:hypothetical protein [Paenibacillus dakarensis]